MPSYIFILCPPFSGSTVLWKLIATSPKVSSLPMEGQFLPEVNDVMRAAPWDAGQRLPWPTIKEVWCQYWDMTKPLLIEKSPPHLIRTADIVEHFAPAYFLIMVRNPYAHCEGLMRRRGWEVTRAAQFTARCLRQQVENARTLPRNTRFTYEQLTSDPAAISAAAQQLIPELGTLKHDASFAVQSINGVAERKLTNFNTKKINNLSRGQVLRINEVLREEREALDYWGYGLYQPSLGHNLYFLPTRTQLLWQKTAAKVGSVVGRLWRKRASA